MDKTSLFKLTYGLFVAGVEEEGKKNGCIINTAVQATSEPMVMNVTMMKENLTTELIRKKGSLSVSVLSLDCPLDLISSFGMRSGRDYDKFDNIEYKTDKNGNPYLKKHTIAYMSLEVTSILDMGTHYLFICDVVDGGNLEEGQPMTYADYRAIKSGRTVNKTYNDTEDKVYICTVCHYVYDQDTPFEELPDDWLCPVCKQPKSKFLLES
ncbi:MAG TPA: hypothetical protein GX705_06565 [Clostridiales bacterium]|nr:hypothetical protein [Clostridiales bacterium]